MIIEYNSPVNPISCCKEEKEVPSTCMFDILKQSPEIVSTLAKAIVILGIPSIAFLSHRLGFKKAEDNINKRVRIINSFTESLKKKSLY